MFQNATYTCQGWRKKERENERGIDERDFSVKEGKSAQQRPKIYDPIMMRLLRLPSKMSLTRFEFDNRRHFLRFVFFCCCTAWTHGCLQERRKLLRLLRCSTGTGTITTTTTELGNFIAARRHGVDRAPAQRLARPVCPVLRTCFHRVLSRSDTHVSRSFITPHRHSSVELLLSFIFSFSFWQHRLRCPTCIVVDQVALFIREVIDSWARLEKVVVHRNLQCREPSSMFRLVGSRSSSTFRLLHRPRSSWAGSFAAQRAYFFGVGNNDDDSDDEKISSFQEGGDSSKDPTGGKKPPSVVVVPSKLSYGDGAPRIPHMYALPVVSRPLFPGMITSVTINDKETIDAFEKLQEKSDNAAYISCFLRKKHSDGVSEGGVLLPRPEVITDPSDIYDTGTFAQIQRFSRGVSNVRRTQGPEDDTDDEDDLVATLTLLGHRRVDLVSVDDIGPPIDVTVKHWSRMEYATPDDTIRALINEIISTIREVAQMNALFRESLTVFPMQFDANDPYKLADFAASISASGSSEDLQAVLAEKDPEMRLHKALLLLNREREVSRLQKEISAKVEEKMTEAQRKYFLTEQLKSIKKELGMERDDKDAIIDKYRKTLAEYPEVPEEAMETIETELEKFSTLEKNSPEFNVTRSYLDWLVGVPWGVVTDENFDIKKARVILDRDHYGLDDVKDAILQFIAIGKLKGTVQGKIICLAGPPGTGTAHHGCSLSDHLDSFHRLFV